MDNEFGEGTDGEVSSDNASNEAVDNEAVNSGAGNGNNEEEDSGSKVNPAWNPVLEKLPEAYRREILPSLQEWDRNYQSRDEKFAPYKKFIDEKVDPSSIESAIGLANAIRSDPRSVFDALNQRFNFANNSLAEENAGEEEDEESEDSENLDPVVAQLRSELSDLTAKQAEREQQEIDAEAHRTIQHEFSEVENRLGRELSQSEFELIVDIAQGMEDISVERAADRLFKSGYLQSKTAPETHGSNGLPVPPKVKLGTKDDDDSILALMKQMGLAQ